MVNNNKRDTNYNTFSRKRVKYFSYEEEFYCNDASHNIHKDVDKIQGIYLLIGGLILIASLCILGFDLFLQTPHDGITSVDFEQQERSVHERRHTNTPASNLSSTPPVLAPMEYWL